MYLRITILLIFLANLIGCVTTHYGNYAVAPESFNKEMANDTAKQLVALYPPARTRLVFKQPNKDLYGTSLVASLRAKGYSVVETQEKGIKFSVRAPSASSIFGIDLCYVVDSPIRNKLYRVTVILGHQSISRAYTLQNGSIVPIGYWVRKE